MPEPSLVLWIIGAPIVLAIVDLVRTRRALRGSAPSAGGVWSKALKIDRPADVPVGRP